MIMNKKTISFALALVFSMALVLTSCSGKRKAHRCPAYNGSANQTTSQADLPA